MFDWNLVVECILNEGCDHQLKEKSIIFQTCSCSLLSFGCWLDGRPPKHKKVGVFPTWLLFWREAASGPTGEVLSKLLISY